MRRYPPAIPSLILLALLLGLLLAACGKAPLASAGILRFRNPRRNPDRRTGRGAGASGAAAVLREFDRLHRTYHAWQPSELSELNAAIAAGKTHRSPEMAALIADAQRVPRLAKAVRSGHRRADRLWGFQSDEFKPVLPDPARWPPGARPVRASPMCSSTACR
jgi:thiamine biosynthesis lipoprotein